jgi:hypothetical protein
LTAYFGDHCLGFLSEYELVGFLHYALRRLHEGQGQDVVAGLREAEPQIDPPRPSGAWLKFDGASISVWFGQHCCGIAYGTVVLEFLRRAWVRTVGEQQANLVEISALHPHTTLRVS